MSCVNCGSERQQQKSSDQKIEELAKKIAKDENRTVGLYRNEYGELCIATGGEACTRFITPNL